MYIMFVAATHHMGFRRWFKIGVYILLPIMLILAYALWQLSRPAGRMGDLISVQVAQGQTADQIADELKRRGLIRSKFWFKTWLTLSQKEAQLKSGSYALPANVNILNLTYLLSGGVAPTNEVTITIIEGWTIEQIDDYLYRNGLMRKKEFSSYVTSKEVSRSVMKEVDSPLIDSTELNSLEGYLFPDTYRVYRDISAAVLTRKMINNLITRLEDQLNDEIRSSSFNLHQILTLASIVEREVRQPEDMAMTADIFIRRLRNGIGLQADSTINYVTGKNVPSVSAVDLSIDSPYNTYKYKGLPPGPISNPGLLAITAVLRPKANDYWYFLTTKTGEVIYSRTFAEHQQAKIRYLR